MAGNANSGRRQEKPFYDALRMEIADLKGDRKGLRRVAKRLIEEAEKGEAWAVKELADRVDGKPVQAVAGDPDNPLAIFSKIELVGVRPSGPDTDTR